MGTWNGLDWILAAIVLLSALSAAFEGFVREMIALGSLVAAIGVAALGYGRLAPWFEDLTRSDAIAKGFAFLALFLATLAVGAIASAIARRLVKEANLTGADRFLGGLFGLVRGVVIGSILLMVLVAFSIKPAEVEQSELAPYVLTGARVMVLAMPADLKARFHTGFESFQSALIESAKKAQEKKRPAR